MMETRLLAARMTWVCQRPLPTRSYSLSAWLGIMRIMNLVSVAINVGICIFVMRPFSEWSRKSQLTLFVLAEHSLIALMFVVHGSVPEKSDFLQDLIELNK